MIRDSVYTLITRSFIILMKLVYSVFINRTLGPTLKGAFELIQLAVDTLTRFGTFGFDQANTFISGRKPGHVPSLISNSYRLTAIFTLPAIVLGAAYMLLPKNQNIFLHVPHWAGFFALIVIPVAILDMLLESILYGENRIWVRNLHEFLRVVSALLFMGIYVVILKWAVEGAVYGYVLINLVLLSFTFVILKRFHQVKGGGASPALATEAWKFGRFTWGANFASYLFYNADRWMINALTPGHPNHVLEQVGLYSTAVNIIVNIWIIPDAIQTSLLPKITRKGESERKKLVPPSLRAVTLLVVIGMVVLAVIGKPAIGFLYNRHISMTADYHENIFRLLSWSPPWDFTKAYVPMVLLMPGILTLSLAKVFTADFFSRGKPHYAMWVSVTSLVLNVILNLILIPSSFFIGTLPISGMNGAAIASSISYTFSFLMFLYYYVRESGERSRDIMLPKSSDFRLVGSWLKEAWARAGRKLDAVEDDDTVKLIGVDDEIDAEDMHRDQEDKQ